jgi:SAM-dependent methyltransferase
MINRLASALRTRGVRGVWFSIRARFIPPRARCYRTCVALLEDRTGLEIGGPSGIFSRGGLLPVYPVVQRLDNCNFARTTVWEGAISEGDTFRFDPSRPPGRQYIAEATNLAQVPAESYGFVLSSHTLEHTANPLAALYEWMRILEAQGVLVLIVPHKEGTFDHRRPVTTLGHLVEDWECGTAEDDLTHLPEILRLHDLSRDPAAGDSAAFAARSARNAENRCLHHHVFDTNLVVEVLDHVGMQILSVEAVWPFHIIAVARKLPPGDEPDNDGFKAEAAEFRRRSPFSSDRAHAGRRG